MKIEEAQLFFPFNAEDDLDELWEERLFKHKQFFLTRPPIPKVFLARLKKIAQQYEAYQTLSNKTLILSKEVENKLNEFDEIVIRAFNQLFQYRNHFKSQLLAVEDYFSLSKIINEWVATEKKYTLKWTFDASLKNENETIISKENDPMVILKHLKIWDQHTPPQKTFTTLKREYSFLPDILKSETKRLTLLNSKNNE